jgi:hypothetical protein
MEHRAWRNNFEFRIADCEFKKSGQQGFIRKLVKQLDFLPLTARSALSLSKGSLLTAYYLTNRRINEFPYRLLDPDS